MRLRCAVPEIPAKISVPPGSPLNKPRPLPTRAESTLPQPLIPLNFISFRNSVYRKSGEGPSRPDSEVLQLVTTCLPILRTRTNTRNPIPLIHLLHNSRTRRGYLSRGTANLDCRPPYSGSLVKGRGTRATAPLVLAYRCAANRKVPESRQLLMRHRRQETYPLWVVSNVLRADIGCGIRRLPNPIARRSQNTGRDRTRKKAWVQRSKMAF
jgi:hypothetical protein